MINLVHHNFLERVLSETSCRVWRLMALEANEHATGRFMVQFVRMSPYRARMYILTLWTMLHKKISHLQLQWIPPACHGFQPRRWNFCFFAIDGCEEATGGAQWNISCSLFSSSKVLCHSSHMHYNPPSSSLTKCEAPGNRVCTIWSQRADRTCRDSGHHRYTHLPRARRALRRGAP